MARKPNVEYFHSPDRQLLKIIGRRIKRTRMLKGHIAWLLAKKLNVKTDTIVTIEHGRSNITVVGLFRLAEMIGCRVHDLIPTEEELAIERGLDPRAERVQDLNAQRILANYVTLSDEGKSLAAQQFAQLCRQLPKKARSQDPAQSA